MPTTGSNRRTRRTPPARGGGTSSGKGLPHDASGAMPPRSESRIDRIARRAHEIYEARGGQHGKAMEDWLQAEREIDAEIEASRSDQ